MKKIIFQPVKPFHITQPFGGNRICISTDGKNKVITCDGLNPPEGYKSLYGKEGHGGVDVRAYHGQELYACQGGTVYSIDTNPKSGLDVRIESNENGIKFRLIYEHLMGYQVKVGDKVKVGQLIGWTDNTGYSSGDHLHLQMEVYKNRKWNKVDPMLYMEPIFALDFLKVIDRFAYLKELVAKFLDNIAYKIRK